MKNLSLHLSIFIATIVCTSSLNRSSVIVASPLILHNGCAGQLLMAVMSLVNFDSFIRTQAPHFSKDREFLNRSTWTSWLECKIEVNIWFWPIEEEWGETRPTTSYFRLLQIPNVSTDIACSFLTLLWLVLHRILSEKTMMFFESRPLIVTFSGWDEGKESVADGILVCYREGEASWEALKGEFYAMRIGEIKMKIDTALVVRKTVW